MSWESPIWMRRLPDNVSLLFLPPYSPELTAKLPRQRVYEPEAIVDACCA
jgi:hypothetical protein